MYVSTKHGGHWSQLYKYKLNNSFWAERCKYLHFYKHFCEKKLVWKEGTLKRLDFQFGDNSFGNFEFLNFEGYEQNR